MAGAIGMGTINNWIAGGATTALGLNQYYKGKKMLKNNQRPSYEIPDEIKQNLSDAQQQALQGLPEEQQQQFLNNIQRSSAYGMSQLGSRKAGLAGVSAMNQNSNDAYGNLLSMNSQAQMQNKQQLMQQRGIMADYKGQAFQLNKLNPYYEKQAEGLAMKGAGMQNVGNSYQIAAGGSGSSGTGEPQQQQQQQGGRYQMQPMGNMNNMGNYNSQQNPNGVVPDNQNGYGSGEYQYA